jgi:chromate transport protein ChrA
MLEQTLKPMKHGHTTSALENINATNGSSNFLEAIQKKIDSLHAHSRQGLWHIATFILISIVALLCRDINILDHFSESVRAVLGAPPAPFLIHIVLAVSTISAVIIIAGRLGNEAEPGRNWEQLGHRAAFYVFYFFSNALDTYFMIIFAAGLLVLLLEHYHIWTYYSKAIRQEQELIKKVSLWPLIASEWNK